MSTVLVKLIPFGILALQDVGRHPRVTLNKEDEADEVSRNICAAFQLSPRFLITRVKIAGNSTPVPKSLQWILSKMWNELLDGSKRFLVDLDIKANTLILYIDTGELLLIRFGYRFAQSILTDAILLQYNLCTLPNSAELLR